MTPYAQLRNALVDAYQEQEQYKTDCEQFVAKLAGWFSEYLIDGERMPPVRLSAPDDSWGHHGWTELKWDDSARGHFRLVVPFGKLVLSLSLAVKKTAEGFEIEWADEVAPNRFTYKVKTQSLEGLRGTFDDWVKGTVEESKGHHKRWLAGEKSARAVGFKPTTD